MQDNCILVSLGNMFKNNKLEVWDKVRNSRSESFNSQNRPILDDIFYPEQMCIEANFK